jgi:Transposase zinc-binding domain
MGCRRSARERVSPWRVVGASAARSWQALRGWGRAAETGELLPLSFVSMCGLTRAITGPCPRCGHDATRRWLERQRDLLLPVPYFHVVFTLPAELRRPVREHRQALIGALFRAAFEALAALCADPRWLGGRVGALAVLHTWTFFF